MSIRYRMISNGGTCWNESRASLKLKKAIGSLKSCRRSGLRLILRNLGMPLYDSVRWLLV